MNRFFYIIILSLLFIQCEDDKHIPVSNKNVPGKYIHLDTENIYLFVPEDVRMYSNSEYAQAINNLDNEEHRKIERARYLNLKYGGAGAFYIMASENRDTDIAFKTVPHITIDQSSSQMLLQYLNNDHKAVGEIIGLKSNFKKAGIIKIGRDRMFRAIFSYKGMDLITARDVEVETYFYLINKKGKSFVLTFNSRKAYDFDSYVQKIKL